MPWENIKLNTGREVPGIGFGTWKIPPPNTASNVDTAFDVGFSHVDTAQAYGNETEVGVALKESGLSRSDIWVTTKWSGRPWGNGESIDPATSLDESLVKLGLKHVDLYLVHTPRLFGSRDNIRHGWKEIVALQKSGKTKSIGVSNFTLDDMKELIEGGEKRPEMLPAANQIELHPYVWDAYRANVEYCQRHGIAIEAYSPLKPLTTYPGGPVDKPVAEIALRLNVKPEQVLLAWIKSKGAIALTTSRSKERLEAYVAAGDVQLSEDDTRAIEAAGRKGTQTAFRKWAGNIAYFMAASAVGQILASCGSKYINEGKLW